MPAAFANTASISIGLPHHTNKFLIEEEIVDYKEDITGQKFGSLIALKFSHVSNGRSHWECLCENCGEIKIFRVGSLKGGTKICKECYFNRGSKTRCIEYRIWKEIKQRCYNKKSKDYPRYGGRGIEMYELWINNFQAFYNYLQTLPETREQFEARTGCSGKESTLDRIDFNDSYIPDNLRWLTMKEQSQNRRDNVLTVQIVKFILWEKLINKSKVPNIMSKIQFEFNYQGSYGALKDVFYGRSWTNINIDTEIAEYRRFSNVIV